MPKVKSKDGTEIAYTKVGTGPALIIVFGATAFRETAPEEATLAEMLAPNFTVITYDRRGRGESGNTLPFAPKREIEDIAALIQMAGGRANVLGYSSGSVVALEAAASALPIDKLVMYEPPIILPGQPFPPPPADYVETLNRLAQSDDKGAPFAYFMQSLGTPPEALEEMKKTPIWPVMESIGPTIAYDGQFMFDAYFTAGKFPARWKHALMPVLILDGDASFPFMNAAANAVATQLPNATRKTLSGQDHGPKPEAIAPVLREFLGS
jgi:pimeloyl-ACP methyl ester carboxylesterase